MAKRVADTYLTDRNFDDDDDGDYAKEERGTFVTASTNVLRNREIKKARRKGVGNEDNSSSSTSAFKGFTGFTGSFGSGSTGFNFGSGSLTGVGNKVSTSIPALTTLSVPTGSTAINTASKSAGFGFGFTTTKPATDNGTTHTGAAKSMQPNLPPDHQAKDVLPAAYIQKLKCLNESLLRWIDQHVRASPCCILTPVFRDYDKHVDNLNKTFNVTPDQLSGSSQTVRTDVSPAAVTSTVVANSADKCATSTSTTARTTSSAVVSSLPTAFNSSAAYASPGFFTATSTKASAPAAQSSQSPLFSFSASSPASAAASTTTASLGSSTFPGGFGTNPVSGFSFGTSGFKFGSGATQPPVASVADQPVSGNTNVAEDDEEYVPPKPESVEIKEDDAFYTVRCKLLYMLNNDWIDRGVGHLYLKPCSPDKTQLLIRSDTTLGNILLNISLTRSIPTSLYNKNSVSLICVPNPPIDSKQDSVKPVCMVIRVKTAEMAQELLKQLSDNKK